jgi:hypothetical protein
MNRKSFNFIEREGVREGRAQDRKILSNYPQVSSAKIMLFLMRKALRIQIG